MKHLSEYARIREVLEVADTLVNLSDVAPEYFATVVEVYQENGKFEGTLLYVPGIASDELLKGSL